MHVHSSPRFIAQSAGQRRIGYREDDVVFSAAKLFFSYGLGNAMFCSMWVGATSVFYPERPTPQTVFEMLRGYQPTMLFAVPTLYAAILADPECTPEKHVESGCGSVFRPASRCRRMSETHGRNDLGVDIVNGVGSTEMGHLFLTNLPKAVEYGTSGVPVDGYKLRLVDEEGRDVGDNEIGELLVHGESAAAGYWNQREKSRRTFVGEWTRTGDKYVRRPDGVYTYCGRTDDMFKVSGDLGIAVRGRGGIGFPSASPRSRGRAGRGRQRADQAESIRGAQGLQRKRCRPGAVRRTQGACETRNWPLEISALDRVRRQFAQDRDRKNPTFHAARYRV